MTIPTAPNPIKFSDINTELGRNSNLRFDFDDADGRKLASAGLTGQSLTPGTIVKLSNFSNHSRANIIISSDTLNANILVSAKGVSYSFNNTYVTLTVNSGIYLGSSVVTSPAVAMGGFGPGDIVDIKNYGTIIGAGGAGGASGYSLQGGSDGGGGGTAIYAEQYLTVQNNGIIAGGGGGGGGNAGFRQQQIIGYSSHSGAAGGGGAGYVGGPGGQSGGSSGTRTAGGGPGSAESPGGQGGGPGQDGIRPQWSGEGVLFSPGLAGYYVNGVTYVTLSGNAGLGRIV